MNPPYPLYDLGRIPIDSAQRDRWKRGELHHVWRSRFPSLFDDDDFGLACNQCHLGFHFVEWLGAIVLHHTTGFHALVGKYEFAKHARKQEIVQTLLPESVRQVLSDRSKPAQCPDLLMYAPDQSDWFFCEIKGPGDRLRPQQRIVFESLGAAGKRPVRLLTFTNPSPTTRDRAHG